MKKVISIIIVLTIIFFETGIVSQASTSSSKGIYSVKCISTQNQANVEIYLGNYTGFSTVYLSNPNRIVIDINDAKAPVTQVVKKFSSIFLKSVRYALRGTSNSRVVIDVKGRPNYKVQTKSGKIVVYVMNPLTKGLSYFVDDVNADLMIGSLKLYVSGKKKYTEKSELSGKRFTITYSTSLISIANVTKTINDKFIRTIKVINNSSKKTTSIVIDAKYKFIYSPASDSKVKSTIIRIKKISTPAATQTPTAKPTSTPTHTPSSTPTPTPVNGIKGVSYTNVSGSVCLTISSIKLVDENLKKYFLGAYSSANLTYTIKFKSSLANLSTGTLTVNDSILKTIAISKNTVSGITSIVIKSKAKYTYNLTYDSAKSCTKISFSTSSPAKNISYYRNGDRTTVTLKGAHLTDLVYSSVTDRTTVKNLYTKVYDATGCKFTISFSDSCANIGAGLFMINDDLLNSVEVIRDSVKKTTSISFNTTQKFNYNILTATNSNGVPTETIITVCKQYTLADKLVVIDPGHGGYDSGAVSGSIYESNVNLDIALRLNALLKAKGVKTYMTRQDDTFVGLYERAFIANTLNASLFLCIHNNSSDNASANGTESFYTSRTMTGYNISSQNFAKLVQNSLINTLKSNNRGAILRPNLVALKATNMPCTLTEVGFLSNSTERSKLCNSTYKQNAAKALCDAIVASLAYK